MSDSLEGLVEVLVRTGVLDAGLGAELVSAGVSGEVGGVGFDALGVIDDPEEPAMWWVRSLVQSRWWFWLWLDEIAETQVDDGLVEVIVPAMAELGVELVHDWNLGEPYPDRASGLRIWLNGEVCDFGFPPELSCFAPLVTANRLLAEVGASRRFYFCGRQWFESSFVPEAVMVALLPVEAAGALAASGHVIEAARPFLVDDVLAA
ncbi:MAG: hypothetical protein AAF567_19755 [Actinomycetota bacterium]